MAGILVVLLNGILFSNHFVMKSTPLNSHPFMNVTEAMEFGKVFLNEFIHVFAIINEFIHVLIAWIGFVASIVSRSDGVLARDR